MALVFTHQGKKAVLVQRAKADNSGVEAYDFTEKVLDSISTLAEDTPERQFLSTLNYKVDAERGTATFDWMVKKAMTTVSSSAQLDGTHKEQSRKDQETYVFDKEYTKNILYKNNIDNMVSSLAGIVGSDLASLQLDTNELQYNGFWDIFYTGMAAAQTVLGTDGTTITVAGGTNTVAIGTGSNLADSIVLTLEKANKVGMKGQGLLETHPTFSGIPLSNFVVITDITGLNEISKDERFIPVGAGATMIRTGQVGSFLNVPVILTARMTKAIATKNVRAVILPTGRYSPVILFDRIGGLESRIAPSSEWFTYTSLQVEANWELKFLPRLGMAAYIITEA